MNETLSQLGLFLGEYEHEMETWLRRRLRVLGALLALLAVAGSILTLLVEPSERHTTSLSVTISRTILWLLIIGYFGFARSAPGAERSLLLRSATIMIFLLGVVEALAWILSYSLTIAQPFPLLLTLFALHFSACLFLPWTPRESLTPFVGLFVLYAAAGLTLRQDLAWSDRVLAVTLAPVAFLPGLAVCAWRLRRHRSQFRTRMVGEHFAIMRREFNQARQIHESVFPQPYDDGFVSFDYSYAPMRELGGDFIHLDIGAEGLVHVILIDVTGHGLAAALTVNRLYGELERIRAETPTTDPGEMLRLLNRYVHLTLSRHNVYATATCVTLDPYLSRLTWANGGHPPALLRGVNGTVRELAPTAMMLGALSDAEFEPAPETIELSPKDVLMLYTDGVFEARDRLGAQYGMDRLRTLLRYTPAPRNWPQFLAASVEKHHGGRAEDDVLIASLRFDAPRRAPEYDEAVTVHGT